MIKNNITYYFDDFESDIQNIKYINESLFLPIATGIGGAIAGGGLVGLYKSYRMKLNSCKNIQNQELNDKCQIDVLNNMIQELENKIPSCEKTYNPADCKLKLINKIEEFKNRKLLYMKNMYTLQQVKINSKNI